LFLPARGDGKGIPQTVVCMGICPGKVVSCAEFPKGSRGQTDVGRRAVARRYGR